MFCGEASLVNEKGSTRVAEPLKCRRWSCPDCAPIRKAEVIQDACDGNGERFLTLTCKPDRYASPNEAALAMLEAWREIVRLARKRWGRAACEYFGVWEKHKSGWPHLHVLQRGRFIPFWWLQQEWARLTGAHRVKIEKPETRRGVARYVGKYLGKDPQTFGTQHRYIRSKRWCAPRAERREARGVGGGAWHADWRGRVELACEWWRTGWLVEWKGEALRATRAEALPP